MMVTALLPWIALTVAALAAVLAFERRGVRAGIWVAKPLASAGFIGVAVAAGALETPYGVAILIALGWSMLGDVLLIPRGRGPAFLFGIAAFLIGHLGFVVAFAARGVDGVTVAIGGAILLAPAALVARWLRPRLPRGMALPVAAYIAVISAMVATAVGTFVVAPSALVLAGALAFYGSDLFVARQRFVTQAFVNRLVGLPLYYGAQLLLAASAAEALPG